MLLLYSPSFGLCTIDPTTSIPTLGKELLLHVKESLETLFLSCFPKLLTTALDPLFTCSSSEENLLKNMELFDKLSLRFQDRVLFVKDVVGSDICTWYFYGHGKTQAEVCCQSIVYGTDRKHVKIEFPEVRVYDEVLNILLYEDRYADAKHAAAAKRRAANLARKGVAGEVPSLPHPLGGGGGAAAAVGGGGGAVEAAAVGGAEAGAGGSGHEAAIAQLSVNSSEDELLVDAHLIRCPSTQSMITMCRIPIVTAPGELESLLGSTWRVSSSCWMLLTLATQIITC